MPVGPSAAVREALQPTLLVPVEDLVAGLARDIELPAQPRHLLAFQQAGDESEPFVHCVTLLPRHFASPAKAGKCYLCARNEVLPLCQEGHFLKRKGFPASPADYRRGNRPTIGLPKIGSIDEARLPRRLTALT